MQTKYPLRGTPLYYLLIVAAILLVLILLNWQVIRTVALNFYVPISILFFASGLTMGLIIGIQRGKELAARQIAEQNQENTKTAADPAPENNDEHPDVSSNTHTRIGMAISEFPIRYPNYKTTTPKLDADIRLWLKESGIAKNDREAHVFSTIISEHYQISPERNHSGT